MKRFQITFKGQVYELDVEEMNTGVAPVAQVAPKTTAPQAAPVAPPAPTKAAAAPVKAGAKTISAPMPGKILAVNVKKGDAVKRGAVVCVLEAMKMENEIMANQDGTVSDVSAVVGQTVSTGDVLVVIS